MISTYYNHKTEICIYILQKNRCFRRDVTAKYQLKTAEIKIILIIMIYSLLTIYSLTTFSITMMRRAEYDREISEYLTCESLSEQADCSRDGFQQLGRDSNVISVIYVWLSLFPFVALIFILDFSKTRKFCVNF